VTQICVAAAVLHDTVEDAATLPGELASIFNADVAALVAEVTDDKAERKKLQVEHAAAISPRAKILKLADKTSNLRSLVKSPPAGADASTSPGPTTWRRDCAAPIPGSKHGSMKRRNSLNDRCAEALIALRILRSGCAFPGRGAA
jgi:guanosine-3',5'-bis(diphosphate) 3'-pyrophosphohydrolase